MSHKIVVFVDYQHVSLYLCFVFKYPKNTVSVSSKHSTRRKRILRIYYSAIYRYIYIYIYIVFEKSCENVLQIIVHLLRMKKLLALFDLR